ncbi:MAG: hypothetical protein H6642_15670 [Caldilineaceae bacterium]|nr:hypothetical protein [Caldilineaceae bacterium]
MTISWQRVSAATLKTILPTASGVYWQADAATFTLEIPDYARFWVRAGTIRYACLGDLGDATVRLFGGGLPAAAAWVQKGYLALHAAAVATPDGVVLFAGSSASGKSTLAAAMAQRGYPVLADEVAPLCLAGTAPLAIDATSNCSVLLWQDAIIKLDLDPADYTPLRYGLPRYIVNGLGIPCVSSLRTDVRAIYLLNLHNDPPILQMQLDGSRRVLAITNASFNRYLPQSPDFRQRTFLQLAVKLADVPTYRLVRPRAGWSISELADRVLEDITV